MHLLKREKKLMVCCVIFISICCIYALWIKPLTARLETLERVVPEKTELFNQLLSKHQHIIELQNNVNLINENLQNQPQDFDLLSALEKIVLQTKLTDYDLQSNNSDIYTPRKKTYTETLVTLDIRGITLEQLVEFLAKIPTENNFIRVKNLDIKTTPNPKLLESSMTISHLRVKTVSH